VREAVVVAANSAERTSDALSHAQTANSKQQPPSNSAAARTSAPRRPPRGAA
jgi:hypothetical protein